MSKIKYKIIYWIWRNWHGSYQFKKDWWSRFRWMTRTCCGGDCRNPHWTVDFCCWLEDQWRAYEAEQWEDDDLEYIGVEATAKFFKEMDERDKEGGDE